MHRLTAASILLFWTVVFGGFAHLSLSSRFSSTPQQASELQLLLSSFGGYQVMPVLLMVVSALFGWAILALVTSDHDSYREVEVYAFSTAIFMMCACAALAMFQLGVASTVPAVLTAALATCAATLRHTELRPDADLLDEVESGRTAARQMALSAAHNSLLSRVSGRQIPGNQSPRNNVTSFPIKP